MVVMSGVVSSLCFVRYGEYVLRCFRKGGVYLMMCSILSFSARD